METIEITSWDDFENMVRGHEFRDWVYRGEATASWTLKSSLYRAFEYAEQITSMAKGKPKKIARLRHEAAALRKFQSVAHQFGVPLPKDSDPLEWLAIMQHFGGPTRMLDVTFSPYVAAYFAIETGSGPASIYCIQPKLFHMHNLDLLKNKKTIRKALFTKDDNGLMYAYEPRFATARSLAQQGAFLVAGSLRHSHEEIVQEFGISKPEGFKLIIPPRLRYEGLRFLRRMNITATMLFPDIAGYCRSFHHQALFRVALEGQVGHLPETKE
jgi:hypothetical protein